MFKVRCVRANDPDKSLTLDKVYQVADEVTLGGYLYYRVLLDGGLPVLRLASRFKLIEEESPKMGAIYLVCAIEVGSLEKDSYDVVASSNTATSYIEHTLEGAKKKCEKVQEYLKTEDLLTEYTACIFELHSYFENRPFFVQVKSVH